MSAVDATFGANVDYAMLVKLYSADEQTREQYSPSEIVKARPVPVMSNPKPEFISTSHVERQNLTVRMQMRRFTRLTNAFSKKLDNLKAALSLYFAWYNFCRVHSALRIIPGMPAGISDRIWHSGDLLTAWSNMEIVSSAELNISYDGDAVRSGLMDVRELAPALLATGALLQKANRILNGENTDVSLKVRGEFKHGSFRVDFVVDQGVLETAKSFLQRHPSIKDAKELLEIVFFYVGPGVGLFKLIKWLKKRKVDPNQIVFQNNGNVSIQIGDETTVVSESVYKLYSDIEARQSAEIIVSPLKREGIEKLEIKAGENEETVTNEEEPYFEFELPEGPAELDTTSDALLEIVRLSFNPTHKWGFTDGERHFNATVEDMDFWKRIDNREIAFAEGDQILTRLRTETFKTPNGLRSRHTVAKVLRFIPRPKNL